MDSLTKLMTLEKAIARHVQSGSMVLMGAQLEQMIPFAAGHELIRQGTRDLTLVGPISDILFDQMIGAGCVSRVMAAWVGNASAGIGYCFRRAVEQGIPRHIEVVDYSNFTMALALHAAALGIPFLPTYSTMGSDLLKNNGNLREFSSPVSEEKLRSGARASPRRRDSCKYKGLMPSGTRTCGEAWVLPSTGFGSGEKKLF